MPKKSTNVDYQELERQLSCPTGAYGEEVGREMDATNIGMTTSSFQFLNLEENDRVLELGHGNCGHFDKVIPPDFNIAYHGLEISKIMCQQAKKNHGSQARFNFYDGMNLPFSDDSFSKIISINTIYFWREPKRLISEIERVLKQTGICVLTYAEKKFMVGLPFVKKLFKLYYTSEISRLIKNTSLTINDHKQKTEYVKSKDGNFVKRKYSMVKLCKKP
ncbi:MAG: class I SAM-dependent methyltransferase [Bacteroidota bacterium]